MWVRAAHTRVAHRQHLRVGRVAGWHPLAQQAYLQPALHNQHSVAQRSTMQHSAAQRSERSAAPHLYEAEPGGCAQVHQGHEVQELSRPHALTAAVAVGEEAQDACVSELPGIAF